KARRGRPPKEEKAEPAGKEAAKPRKGRPPKADKAALDEATPTKRDKLSRSGKKAAEVKAAPEPENAAPAPEQSPPEPAAPPRPVEEGKLVYLKLSEMHPFHTFRPHPFKVRDDAKMQETVASIKANGVMVPGLARPEKDGNGYEIVAGHRRHHGCELAGLEEMPFIVRE
ncbi:ParB N-terminal domain-containing protein, partial [Anaerotruncus colihominis]